jgi:hypothetical protein
MVTAMNKEFYLLGYKAVYSGESQPTFRRSISPPSSWPKSELGKKEDEAGSCQSDLRIYNSS